MKCNILSPLKAFWLPRQSGPPTQSRDPHQTLQGARSFLPSREDLLPHQNILFLLLFILQTSHILLLRAQTYVQWRCSPCVYAALVGFWFLFFKRTPPNYANGLLSFSKQQKKRRLNANLKKKPRLRDKERWHDSALLLNAAPLYKKPFNSLQQLRTSHAAM